MRALSIFYGEIKVPYARSRAIYVSARPAYI